LFNPLENNRSIGQYAAVKLIVFIVDAFETDASSFGQCD